MSQDRNLALCPIELPGHVERDPTVTGSAPEPPVSFGLAAAPFYEAFVLWRSGKDSNPHLCPRPVIWRSLRLSYRGIWRGERGSNPQTPLGVTRVAGGPDTITASPHICIYDYREYSYLSPSTSSFSMHSQQPYSILHIKRTQPTSLTLPWLGPNSPMHFYLRLCRQIPENNGIAD